MRRKLTPIYISVMDVRKVVRFILYYLVVELYRENITVECVVNVNTIDRIVGSV